MCLAYAYSCVNSLLVCTEETSPEQARARQSGRQRKQRQYGDEMWDDEMLSGAPGATCAHLGIHQLGAQWRPYKSEQCARD
jgi:hypothetical protein